MIYSKRNWVKRQINHRCNLLLHPNTNRLDTDHARRSWKYRVLRPYWITNQGKRTRVRGAMVGYLSGWTRYQSSISCRVTVGSNQPEYLELSGNCNCRLISSVGRRASNWYISRTALVGIFSIRQGMVRSHLLRWWLQVEWLRTRQNHQRLILTWDPIRKHRALLAGTSLPIPVNIRRWTIECTDGLLEVDCCSARPVPCDGVHLDREPEPYFSTWREKNLKHDVLM